jgi:uncharacterized membrane protein YeaQ/YmgE (transglycosylase-associated protein family)
MTILGWILLGLISGFIASKVVSHEGQGCLTDIALGLVGAVVGGLLFTLVGGRPMMDHFDFYSLFVATIGAIIVLVIYHAIMGRRTLK